MSKFNELINGDTPVLVDFFAEWCGPCKTMAPILTEVSRKLNGKVKIIKVDIDKNQAVAGKYKILSVPTLLLFKRGEIRWKQSGVVPPQELLNVLNQLA
jgi:thioredoxin 1